MRTVTEEIGNEYEDWSNGTKVFISSPTGSGKTEFIISTLLSDYVKQVNNNVFYREHKIGKRILYLVNRKILQQQIEARIRHLGYQHRLSIDVVLYQTIESKMQEIQYSKEYGYRMEAGYENLRGWASYDCVVCDECHYFLADSNFNSNTFLSFRWIQETFFTKIRIFMSATINDIKNCVDKYDNEICQNLMNANDNILQQGNNVMSAFRNFQTISRIKGSKEYIYGNSSERDYSYINIKIIDRYEIENVVVEGEGKWIIFVDQIGFGETLKKNLEDRMKDKHSKKIDFITSAYEKNEESKRIVEKIVNTGTFDSDILIATSVMDNGISIEDVNVKNMIIIAYTEVEFIQMLGRKRKDTEILNLYIVRQKKENFTGKKRKLEESHENIIDLMKQNCIQQQHIWVVHQMRQGAIRYDETSRFTYTFNGIWFLSPLAAYNIEHLLFDYDKVIKDFENDKENAFVREQLKWLGKTQAEAEEIIKESKLTKKDKDLLMVTEEFEKLFKENFNDNMKKEAEKEKKEKEPPQAEKKVDIGLKNKGDTLITLKDYAIIWKKSLTTTLASLVDCIEYNGSPESEEEFNRQKKKVKENMKKGDRPITEEEMEFLRIHYNLPYKVISGKRDKSWIIERIKPEFIPMDKLENLASIRGCLTDEQFEEVYNMAVEIVRPYKDLNRKEQLQKIVSSLQANMIEKIAEVYQADPRSNTPYGYLIMKDPSCAGCTRTVGLCLNILGIPYEHVHENEPTNQWCRVEIDGEYWICDIYKEYCGPEPALYTHPLIE